MEKNVGGFDGMIRTLIFVTILCYAILAGTLIAWLWVIPAAILLATAAFSWCPLYALFNWNSNKDEIGTSH